MTAGTTTTTKSSKLSLNFSFDTELLQHRTYKRTLRSLMRRARSVSDPSAAIEHSQRSALTRNADEVIQGQKHSLMKADWSVIVCGIGVPIFLWTQAPLGLPDFPLGELIAASDTIQRSVIQSLIHDLETIEQDLDNSTWSRNLVLLRSSGLVAPLEPQVVEIVKSCSDAGYAGYLWHSHLS